MYKTKTLLFLVVGFVAVIVVLRLQGRQTASPSFVIGVPERITLPDGFENAVWSPVDSDVLAFINKSIPGTFVHSVRTRETTKLSGTVAGFKFSWTEDGTGIFFRDTSDGLMAIKKIDARSGQISTLIESAKKLEFPQETKPGLIRFGQDEDQEIKFFSIATDKERAAAEPFVYQENDHIYVMRDGSKQRLTDGLGKYYLPILSPDASKVVFEEIATGLYIANLSSAKIVHLGEGTNAAWSPDSQYVIYEVTGDDGHSIARSELYIADILGHKTQVTNTPTLIERRPAWSPDRTRIAFDANGAIYIANLRR